MMTCRTPNMKEGLNMTAIQMGKVSTNITMATKEENPETNTQAGNLETDSNGGNSPNESPDGNGETLVNCTMVRTRRLPNGTQIKETTQIVKKLSECQSLSNTSSTSERSSERKKRAVEIKDLESEPLNDNDLQFYIGFQFDGMETYSNFTSLPVFEDPEYFRFEDKDHVRYHNPKESFLHIKVSKIRDLNLTLNTNFLFL